MSTTHIVTVPAVKYEDNDDCLAAAAAEYAYVHGIPAWRIEANWEGGSNDKARETIVLTVTAI